MRSRLRNKLIWDHFGDTHFDTPINVKWYDRLTGRSGTYRTATYSDSFWWWLEGNGSCDHNRIVFVGGTEVDACYTFKLPDGSYCPRFWIRGFQVLHPKTFKVVRNYPGE